MPNMLSTLSNVETIKGQKAANALAQMRVENAPQQYAQEQQIRGLQIGELQRANEMQPHIDDAKKVYSAAQYVMQAPDAKDFAEKTYPDFVNQLRSQGVPLETDEDFRQAARHAAAWSASFLGQAPPVQWQTIGDLKNLAGGIVQRNPQTGEIRQAVAPKSEGEGIHAIIGPDGKPVFATSKDAVGKTPYMSSISSTNAPPLPAGDPQVNSYRDQILQGNATLQNVPMNLRGSVAIALNSAPAAQYAPTSASRFTLAANRITQPYTNMSAYKLTADGKPYLERIDAALKNPGSVSDQDLLDSLTKLNTGGNAVTEAQVSLITGGKSFADMASSFNNKFRNGGVLSDNQRQQIHDIAYQIYENYKKGYQPIYEKAASQLTAAGIPKAFWTIPDLNALNSDNASGSQPAQVKSDEDFDALPSGSQFVGPDGVLRRKP